jgi:uncharacterized membrane protein YkoI
VRAALAVAIAGVVALGTQAAAAQPMALRAASELTAADTTAHTAARATAHAAHIRGKKSLKAEAKISDDSAMAIARAQVPGATVTSGKIERENKKLVYKINLRQPGTNGTERVWVDATTGSVVKTKHLGGAPGRAQKSAQKDSTKSTP